MSVLMSRQNAEFILNLRKIQEKMFLSEYRSWIRIRAELKPSFFARTKNCSNVKFKSNNRMWNLLLCHNRADNCKRPWLSRCPPISSTLETALTQWDVNIVLHLPRLITTPICSAKDWALQIWMTIDFR